MNNLNTRDVVIILLCVIICLGASMFFQPCDPRDDDSWMICHWAAQTVIGLGCVMIVISIVKIFMSRDIVLHLMTLKEAVVDDRKEAIDRNYRRACYDIERRVLGAKQLEVAR